jgi:succinate dehydrogenase/fumarate reductase-like Fe-S protein
MVNMEEKKIEIKVSGKKLQVKPGAPLIKALWSEGLPDEIQTGCLGGACGACTVTVRFADGRKGKSDLACMLVTEEGMEIFPYRIEPLPQIPSLEKNPDLEKLKRAFPTIDRCTKCGSCTSACPMDIPVMDSIFRMQRNEFENVAEDFVSCVHCGLCRFVCEDNVKPHNMALWIRRSMASSQETLENKKSDSLPANESEEWKFLLSGDPKERLNRAEIFRETGGVPK